MKDVDDILIGSNGSIYVAPVGTAAPADEVEALNAAFVDLGYASEDGVKLTDSKDMLIYKVWQLRYAAKRKITGRDFAAAFKLSQWNKDTVPLAFGGGTVTAPTAGHFKFVPPSFEDIDERAMVIEWFADDSTFRLIIPRGMVTENVETEVDAGAVSELPITFSVLGTDGVDPWYLLTDHPSFDPA